MPNDLAKALPAAMKKTRTSVIVPSAKNVMTMKATVALTGTETVVATETNRVTRIANGTVRRTANAPVATVLCRAMKAILHVVIRVVPNGAIAMGTTLLKRKDLRKEQQPQVKIHIHWSAKLVIVSG
jgi:hypothetical protein